MTDATPKSLSNSGTPNCSPGWLEDCYDASAPILVSPLYPRYFYDEAGAIKSDSPEPLVQVAPMLAVTDRHFRYMCRLLSRRTQLWTEMVVDATIINAPNLWEHLAFQPVERPIVCQLGGSFVETMGAATRIIGEWGRDWCQTNDSLTYPNRYGAKELIQSFFAPGGLLSGKSVYDEININVGCPSARVSGKGGFGCALMKTPKVVAEVCQRMIRMTHGRVPVTVKCRVGVDDQDEYDDLLKFIKIVSDEGGVRHFIVHARKAWLKGVNPKQNRTLPRLKHERVYKLVADFPHLRFSINGGINDLDEIKDILNLDCQGYEIPEDVEAVSEKKLPKFNKAQGNGLAVEGGFRGLKRANEDVNLDTIAVPEYASPDLSFDEATLATPRSEATVDDYAALDGPKSVSEHAKDAAVYSDRYKVFGAMMGRAVLNNICVLAKADTDIYGEQQNPVTAKTRRSLLMAYCEYLERDFPTTEGLKATFPLMKPTLSVMYGLPGIKNFRRAIDAACRKPELTPKQVLLEAIQDIDETFPGILDYVIGEEPPAREIKAHIKMKLGTWEYGIDRTVKRQKTDDSEVAHQLSSDSCI